MTIKACVFDMDGTLLNTLDDLATSANTVLRQHGFDPHPVEAYRTFVGSGVRNLIIRALPENARNEATIDACLAAFKIHYDTHWADQTHLYEGLTDTLDQLTKQGLKLAILTNKPQPFADLCVDKFLGRWTWNIVQGQQDGLPIKPDAAVSQKVTDALEVSPAEVLYFGDSDVDMFTARNAGYRAIGVSWGFRSIDELNQAGAEQIIHQPHELLNLLN
ncbi:HAD family hydrolase [Reinekea blandensis]|uniref:phosphoglycolate phosphatase n=1 Tax=Reinekea blandensis MED297 TaxID=314283 RepID=A4BG41_9GAMM|nr:HAD family hydrolase [Reinekea blandensis]EAR08836.1 phosphoglycolate phosphatase [Reinekea sp. MED297] [Reinekea blandensis MED297]